MGRYLLTLLLLLLASVAEAACPAKPDVSGVINVRTCGAKGDGVTDDTAAIQAAWTSAKSIPNYPNSLLFPWTGHDYVVSQLNFTNLVPGPRLIGQSAPRTGSPSRIRCREATPNTGVCIDFTGSWYASIENLTIVDDAAGAPLVTVLVAKSNAGDSPGNSQDITIENSQIVNSAGSYAIYDVGAEVTNFNSDFFFGLVVVSAVNTAAVASPFATIQTAPISMTATQWHNNIYTCVAGKGECILLDTGTSFVSNLNIDGGYVSQATPGFIVATGTGAVVALNVSNIRDEPQGGAAVDYFFKAATQVQDATFMNDVFANTVQPTVASLQFNSAVVPSVSGLLTNFRPGDGVATFPAGNVITCAAGAKGSTFWSVDKIGGGAFPVSCAGLTVQY